jgi:branched-chain amino acid transport system ATP-binding protein
VTVLELQGVVSGYGPGDQILKGINFTVAEREIVCIVGPNGAGKSTLLKTVAGLLKPSAGTIRLKGAVIGGMKPKDIARHGVAFVPQEHNVFPSMSIFENLEIGGYVNPAEIRARARDIMARFPMLGAKRGQPARFLSGGQRQLLAVGMALMVNPSLMLLDEPTAGLSPAAAQDLFDEIGRIRDSGIAVALVEQNARDAMAMSDRTYILVDGRNGVSGPSAELLGNSEINRMFLGGR